MFDKSEIDEWLLRTRKKDHAELMEEAREYCATHPIGGWLSMKTEPVLNGAIGPGEDWIDIHEVRAMIPGYPKMNLVRS